MLEGLKPPTKTGQCAVTKLLITLSKSDKAILEDALANTEAWSSNGLSRSLKERGIILGDFTITKHRNKACLCFRS